MPTNRIDAKAFKQDGDLLNVAVADNDQAAPQFKAFEMTVLQGMTRFEMGQTALDQPITPIPDPVFNGTFDLAWHIETYIDPETGFEYRRRVLDSITPI